MRSFLLFLICCSCFRLSGQEMYTVAWGSIFKITYPEFNQQLIWERPPGFSSFDITLDTSGNMYSVFSTLIQRIDVDNQNKQDLFIINSLNGFNGMMTDASNSIWLSGKNLYNVTIDGTLIMDKGMLSIPCVGDLTFWNEDLFMTTNTYQLLKVDKDNPLNSNVFMDLDEEKKGGLATIWNCVTGQTRTFAFGEGSVLEIDFENKSYELATDLKIGAAGATSPTEWHASLPFHKAIDTILLSNPLCGMSDGAIEFVPETSENGALAFSLDGSVWQSSGLFTQLSAGLYTVHIRGGSCKKITHNVVLDNMNAAPIVAAALTPAVCLVFSGSIVVRDTSTTALEYSLDGQNWQTDSLFTGLGTGWYTVTAQDADGCLSFAEAYVRDSNSMFIEQILRNQDTAAVCAGTTVTMRALGDPAWSYAWSENGVPLEGLNSFLVFVAPSDTGWVRYRVTATDANGCTTTTVPLDYWVFDCSVLPNAFTPDGDGVNDTFGITGIPEQWKVDLVVFDRWGNQVFQSTPDQKFWNGTVNNQPAASDVYVYRLHITLPDGVFVEKKGDVTLLR